MKRHRDKLVIAGVLAVILGMASLVVVALLNGQANGRQRLAELQTQQVNQLARSMDTRITQAFSAFAGFVNAPPGYHATLRDPADASRLAQLQALSPKATAGLVIVDTQSRVTNGTLLRDPTVLGKPLARNGLPGVLAGKPAVLPVATGLTSAEPTIAIAYPIRGASGQVVGAFLVESVVSTASDFNQEVSQLGTQAGAEYTFVDSNGAVVASSNPSLFGHRLDEPLLGTTAGLRRGHDSIVIVEPVKSAGWRAVFRQPIAQFDGPLTNPLHSALLLMAVLAVIAAGLSSVLLVRALSRAREEHARLRAINEAREEFISIVSHELRTPVVGVLGFLQTTLDHWETMGEPARHRAVTRAWANAQRLHSLTRDVLDATSLESGQLQYCRQPLDLRLELSTATIAAQELQPDRRVSLLASNDPIWVDADAERLRQVLTNLLDNALKGSPVETPIEVEGEIREGMAVITVRDRGPGLTESDLRRVFEKFVQGRGSRVSGSGLGLYICRQIVEAHNGRVYAANDPDGGAIFTVELPLCSAPLEPVGA